VQRLLIFILFFCSQINSMAATLNSAANNITNITSQSMSPKKHTISQPKTLGILLFPGFEILDAFGPLEMFSIIPDKIKIILIGDVSGTSRTVKSFQGVSVVVDTNLQNVPHLDILLVPGGMGTRKEVSNPTLLAWIKARSATAELTLSVCTGAALLAKAGVLDNHKATSNKIAFEWVKEQGPKVHWVNKARWVDDGNIITSSGVSAGMDMSLYVISKLYGTAVSEEVAKITEYNFNADPSDDKFSSSAK